MPQIRDLFDGQLHNEGMASSPVHSDCSSKFIASIHRYAFSRVRFHEGENPSFAHLSTLTQSATTAAYYL